MPPSRGHKALNRSHQPGAADSASSIAVLTIVRPRRRPADGRFSGGTTGPYVAHIAPEASKGGPVALVRDGDPIRTSLPHRVLDPVKEVANLS